MAESDDRTERASGGKTYRAGIAVVLATSFLTVWTTVVRDDGNGIGFFLLIMAAAVGAFSAWFRPAGMARTMLGVAIMQVLLGIAIATAPSPICCSRRSSACRCARTREAWACARRCSTCRCSTSSPSPEPARDA